MKLKANAPWSQDALATYLLHHGAPGVKGNPDPEYWLPRIALLSGMRLGEICSLEREDVLVAEGVTYFDIPKGKAEGSIRVVPVHPAIEPFLELAPTRGFLFPNLTQGGPDRKRSWNIGKVLGRRFKVIEGASTFHGFRKNVAEAFERHRIPETEASQILGHKKAGMTYGVYSPNGLTIQQKRDLVAKLSLPNEGARGGPPATTDEPVFASAAIPT
jgi:integrase